MGLQHRISEQDNVQRLEDCVLVSPSGLKNTALIIHIIYINIIQEGENCFMFDENQLVIVKWHSQNKQYFINLGFDFTKIGEEFLVPAKLLPIHNRSIVKCNCDYCGKEYETIYSRYTKSKERGKLSCSDCKELKKKDTMQEKYGYSSVGAVPKFREKGKQAMKEKYGHEYAMQTERGQEKFKSTMIEKYGVNNPVKSPELKLKAHKSMFQHGLVPTSKPERKMVEMLKQQYGKENCYPSYPTEKAVLDCLIIVNGIKIDVEYDGNYWHKNKVEKDKERNEWLISNGYKVLRIKGDKRDKLLTIQEISKEINDLLEGKNLIYIDMNN